LLHLFDLQEVKKIEFLRKKSKAKDIQTAELGTPVVNAQITRTFNKYASMKMFTYF